MSLLHQSKLNNNYYPKCLLKLQLKKQGKKILDLDPDGHGVAIGATFSSTSIESKVLNSSGIGLQYPGLAPYGGTPVIYFDVLGKVGEGEVGE